MSQNSSHRRGGFAARRVGRSGPDSGFETRTRDIGSFRVFLSVGGKNLTFAMEPIMHVWQRGRDFLL